MGSKGARVSARAQRRYRILWPWNEQRWGGFACLPLRLATCLRTEDLIMLQNTNAITAG